MLFLQLIATLVTQPQAVSVEGFVTDFETGAAIHGARVELGSGRVAAISDSSGHYALAWEGARGGSQRMRVLRLGYETQTIELVLPALGALRVDVALRATAALMPLVRVSGVPAITRSRMTSDRRPDVRWRSVTNPSREPILAESDALAAFGAEHDVAFASDVPNSMHVRGGSSDQLRFLIDGVPLYTSTHSAGAFGAVNPDAIDGIALHTGARSAAFGNALAGTLAAHTRPPASAWHLRGGVSTTALRLTSDGPLVPGRSDLIVSARRGSPSFFAGRPDKTRLTAAFTDWLLKSSTRIGAGTVSLLATAANDRVAFSNRPEDDTSARNVLGRHAFDWGGGTLAALWTAPLDSRTQFNANVWRAEFDGDALWLSAEPLHMRSTRQTHAVGATATRRFAVAEGRFGAEVQHDRIAYDVMNLTTATSTADAALRGGARSSVAMFAEYFAQGAYWDVRSGLRALYSGAVYLEPRVAASYSPTVFLTIHAGVGRNYQTVQSLRNPESPAAAVFGADLPVLARGNIPVAQSDEATYGITAAIGASARLALDGYSRRLTGLVLGHPESGTPFTLGSPAVGTGRVTGLGASFERQGDRLTTRLAAGASKTERMIDGNHSDAAVYQPNFANTRSLTAAVGYRIGAETTLRSAFFARWGRRTTLFDGSFDWEGCDVLDGGCQIAGTPGQSSTTLSGSRLPPYLRWDVGARRSWTVTVSGRSMELEAHATIGNILDRRNIWTLGAGAADQPPRALMQRPLSVLTAGLDFRY